MRHRFLEQTCTILKVCGRARAFPFFTSNIVKLKCNCAWDTEHICKGDLNRNIDSHCLTGYKPSQYQLNNGNATILAHLNLQCRKKKKIKVLTAKSHVS